MAAVIFGGDCRQQGASCQGLACGCSQLVAVVGLILKSCSLTRVAVDAGCARGPQLEVWMETSPCGLPMRSGLPHNMAAGSQDERLRETSGKAVRPLGPSFGSHIPSLSSYPVS